jgi:plasmid stabilization system protein ParE
MTFEVVLQRLAKSDLRAAYRWAAERAPFAAARAPFAAARWLDRFQDLLQTLTHHPERCPLARENGKVDDEIRECLFGKRPYVFRVIFTIIDRSVRVLRIRRAQRRFLTRAELEKALTPDD